MWGELARKGLRVQEWGYLSTPPVPSPLRKAYPLSFLLTVPCSRPMTTSKYHSRLPKRRQVKSRGLPVWLSVGTLVSGAAWADLPGRFSASWRIANSRLCVWCCWLANWRPDSPVWLAQLCIRRRRPIELTARGRHHSGGWLGVREGARAAKGVRSNGRLALHSSGFTLKLPYALQINASGSSNLRGHEYRLRISNLLVTPLAPSSD